MNYDRIHTVLNFKSKNNSCYYKVKKKIYIADQDITIYKGANLYSMHIDSGVKNKIYLSVMYPEFPEEPVNSEDVIEGIVSIDFQEIISLLIADKIEALYTNNDKRDKEIYNLIGKAKIN